MRERILLALFALSFPLVAYLSTLPPQRFRNDVTQWGNRSSIAFANFSEYRKQFGANELVLLSWPGCDLNDPRIETVTTRIETEFPDQVCRVSNGQRAYWSLRDRAKLSHAEAINRLQNVFIGEANDKTAVGFQFTEKGRLERSAILTKLEGMLETTGVEPDEVVYAGLGHNLYTLDKEGLESPFRMVPQIMLLAFVLTVLFVRNVWLAFFINALGTFAGCLSFNFVWLAGVDMNAIIWPLPTLTMLLTVSAALHFLSYYRKAVEACRQDGVFAPVAEIASRQQKLIEGRAVGRMALRFSISPILCCTITTVIGLLSLTLSTSEPVRQFGVFGAMSMTATNLLLLFWFPPFLTLIGYFRSVLDSIQIQTEHSPKHDRWKHWVSFTKVRRWWIVSVCLAAILVGAFGISKVKTGSSLDNFFPAEHHVLSSAAEMESRVGPLNSVELLLDFNNVDAKNDRQRLKGLQALGDRIPSRTDFESSLSAGIFSPRLQRRRGALAETVERNRLESFKEELVQAGLVHADPQKNREVWRVSCRYSIFDTIDLNEQADLLKQMVHELFFRDGELVFPGETLSVTTTGEFVLFDLIDRQFFDELMLTYGTAFVIIMLMMFSVLQSLRMSLIALLPNLFPALVVLGAAGFLGYSLDVASLMTASVALGIAVDDTLHFLMWNQKVRNSQEAGEPREDAVESAVRYCGKAMLQTSVILGLSIVLYAFCGFLPTVRFGILLSAMLLAALVGDLLLLPALLAIAEEKEE